MFPPNLFSNIIKHRKMPVSPMNVFPEEFGPKYDSTLQILAQEFLSRLEKLLPSPNLQQTASWLSIDPTLLEECVQSVAHPEPLQTLLQHHKNGHQLDSNALRSVGGDYILGSLSSHSSVKESSVYSQTGPERQSYPTMQGYQSPFPCEEPGTKWDCRMAEYRVWTVKPPAGSASVEVEVNEIEESSERTSKRKTVDKETVKETKRDKAVLCPQTRSGLKTSRLTASCLRRKPVLQLKRLDISNMALPKSLLTLILRRGRLQTEGEATRRPGPKRRGRKKKRRKGGGVTDEVTVTHTCDVSDMPPPKSSLTLTLKRGIMQAEATSSQVPKKRGRKKGPKTGPGITRLKIEKIGAESLDISDVPLPKPSLKLIIRRGKLQGEAIDSQGQIPKKRGRKKKHRRGIKDEKTQAKGAKRDMSAESEEDKPSDYELWTTVTQGSPVHKSTTLDQSGGVHVGPHCSSSHKRMDKELKKHTLHVHTEKHCAQMAVRQNCEEVLENVPQDSLTPELPNNSHKIQFHLEKHSGQMAERQKEEEFLESVQQDSRTEKLPLVSPTENLPQVSKKEKVPQVTVTEKVPQDSLTDKVPQDSLTEKVPQDSLTERVPQDSLTEKVPQESLTEKVPQESPTEKVPQEPPTEKVPQEPPTEKVPQESLSEKVPQESLTEKVPQESLTEKVPQESLTEKVPQESLTEKVPQDSFRNKVPQDLLTPEPSNTCHKRSQRVKACSFCGKTFTDTLGLTRHMRSHIEQRSHQCMECGQDFEFSEDLEEHQKHCKKLKKENVDYYCGENVQQKNDLKINSDRKRHKRNDLEGNEKLDLKGDEKIDVKVEEQSNLKADAHGSIKCHVCGKITTRMLGLRRHLLLHFNNGAFKCPACPKTFISNADLRSHLRLKQSCREKCPEEVVNTKVHLQSGPCESICPYCGDSFQLTHELKEHTKECSRKCHVCGKTTSKACDMRRHMLKHYNNGPIKCPVCPKTFISHPDFKMHLKTKKLCREKCSDVMMKELLSSVEGKCKDNINETEVVTKSQQPSSSSTSGPLKSIEEFFEEFSHDLQQSDNSMSSEVNLNSLNSLEEDYSEDMTLYQPMKDVNLNNLHVDYNEMGQYQPIKDDDLNSLQVDYSEDISQYQHIKDPEPEENRMSLDTSGANKISNDKEPNLDKGLTKKQMSHTDASPVQDSLSEKSGEVKNETQRGKLQAEETCSQEPKRRGRKRKQKRRCSVKTEKTEEQGVNKERSTETEEDAEPSNNEHWKTASKAATVNDSGGFHVRLHSQLSLEKEDLHHHKGIIEEHCSRMVNGQNRELLENVPQDSLTTEASNNFKKRSQRVKACSFCGKTFTDTLGLTRHMRSHIEQRSHQCMECGQHFEFVEDLEEHEYSGCEVRKNKTFEVNDEDYSKETEQQKTNLGKITMKRDEKNELNGDKNYDLGGVKKINFQHEKPDLMEDEKPDLMGDDIPEIKGLNISYMKDDEKINLKADTHGSIKCHVCGKITTRLLGLRRHLLLHFNNGAFKCPVCPKTFTTNADLRSHIRLKRSCREKCSGEVIGTKVHLHSGPYICPYCGDTFQLPHDLKEHTKECSRTCQVCGKITSKACNMRKHMLKHNNNGPFKCPVCPKTFLSQANLKMHLKIKVRCREKCSDVMMKELLSSEEGKSKDNVNETTSQQPNSSNADGPVKSIKEFFEGLADVQPDESRISDDLHEDFEVENSDQKKGDYKCSYCRDTFQHLHDLKGHTKECSKKCPVCGKTTSKSCDMRRHMLKHYNNGSIKCPVCPKTFIFHTDLKIHLKTKKLCREKCSDVMIKELLSSVDGRNRKKVHETRKFTKCQKPSSSKTSSPVEGLKSIEKIFHELPHDSQPANNSSSIAVNLNSIHEDKSDRINIKHPIKDTDQSSLSKFNCPYCEDIFQFPNELKGHVRDCSRKCHVCGKICSKTCDRRRHMLKHDNNGPIKCPVCPKTFIFHTDLKTHLKTRKCCREKCSDVMAKELLSSSLECRHIKKLDKTRVLKKCPQPSSSNASGPVLGLKTFEEFFEELSHDSDISMTSGVNLNSLNEDHSNKVVHNQPMKDSDQSNPCQHICPYCGDTFELSHDLREHKKECSKKCNVCGKTTSTSCGMRRHMLKHYNNGPHKCPVCPKTFMFYTDMKKHLKTRKICRENFSNMTVKEPMSSDGQCNEYVSEKGLATRCQQPSTSKTDRPLLGLKSFEEFFEELSQDQPDDSMSSDGLHEDYSDGISQYQPMKDVDLNNLHEDYSDGISQYQPMKDVDMNSLHGDYTDEISQY